jgi:hypothetical protein
MLRACAPLAGLRIDSDPGESDVTWRYDRFLAGLDWLAVGVSSLPGTSLGEDRSVEPRCDLRGIGPPFHSHRIRAAKHRRHCGSSCP